MKVRIGDGFWEHVDKIEDAVAIALAREFRIAPEVLDHDMIDEIERGVWWVYPEGHWEDATSCVTRRQVVEYLAFFRSGRGGRCSETDS